jgi:hypothetical protein
MDFDAVAHMEVHLEFHVLLHLRLPRQASVVASEEYHDGHHENLECPAACVVHRIAQAQPARKPDVTPRKFVD